MECIFCEIAEGKAPAAKVYEDEFVLAFFTLGPVAEYHTLVIPKRHSENIFDIEPPDLQAVISAVQLVSQEYKRQLGLDAIQVINSNGAAGQQDVFHFHFHIVPRRDGDNQDVKWISDNSIVERFDELLQRISIRPT